MIFTLARLRILRYLREWRLRSDLPPDPDLEIEHEYVYQLLVAERQSRRDAERYFRKLFKFRRQAYLRSLAQVPIRNLENVPTAQLASAFGLDKKKFNNLIIELAPWAQTWGDEEIGRNDED